MKTDAFGHPRTTGAAEQVCALVERELSVRARWDKPGTIQRMSSAHASPVDRREARECGKQAVRFALQGRSDCMVILRRSRAGYRITYDTVPLARVASQEKTLPPGFFDRSRMLPTEAFRSYALPLVGPGLPHHARLRQLPARVQR